MLMDCPQVRADRFVVPANEAIKRAELSTDRRLAHFFAQVGHECGGLRYMEEIADGSAYEGRKDLGNTRPGDGKRYKGRGWMQLTGAKNYRAYDEWMGLAGLLAREPERVASVVEYAVMTAPFFWQRNSLNALADEDTGAVIKTQLAGWVAPKLFNKALLAITKRINGGYNGLEDRQRRFDRAMRLLNQMRATDGRSGAFSQS